MSSPWQNPLPVGEEAKNRVVVYFHSDLWIPMTCFCLNEAISLYRKAMRHDKEIFVFPLGLDLETQNILSHELSDLPGEFAVPDEERKMAA